MEVAALGIKNGSILCWGARRLETAHIISHQALQDCGVQDVLRRGWKAANVPGGGLAAGGASSGTAPAGSARGRAPLVE